MFYMKKHLRILLASVCALILGGAASAQDVQWKYTVNAVGENTYEIVFDAAIEESWHMYDLGPYDLMGPSPTAITFEEFSGARIDEPARELAEPIEIYDEVFDMEIGYYENAASFAQTVVVTEPEAKLKGYVEWMVCNDVGCSPLQYWDFEIDLTADGAVAPAASDEASLDPASGDLTAGGRSMWSVILEAILWGFAALLTPCVFPMVPMTVSFFMKGSENKARGRFRAGMYGLFIILLYTLPIAALIIITRIVGGDAVTADIFNWLATHWLPNIIFFVVFMIFAASFFGAFEITMPSKLVNNTDRKSDKGGLGGIFFMALTLVLVSFSCTGPIVGNVLISSISGGNFWQPIVTMLAFSIAFALPFTILALFPALLNKLPKSGGWLNSVKVVLGFVELALGLKFLSVADQVYHWNLLDREIYLALWIAIFTLLGLYLIGKLKFKHDSDFKYLGVGRLVLAIFVFAFVVYMIPGMWGAPLKGLSGYLPPIQTQDFVLGNSGGTAMFVIQGEGEFGNTDSREVKKYADFLPEHPYGIDGYYDFDQAMEAAIAADKPLFIDFTGASCVNCREMEQRVWSDPEVQRILKEEFVVVALYGDDKTKLPEEDWITLDNGKVLKTLGRVNSHFVTTTYGVNQQPGYIIVDHEGKTLVPTRGYNLDIPEYINFLNAGLEAYEAAK